MRYPKVVVKIERTPYHRFGPMKILPVLDLKNGVVVRGIAGRRDTYRPIVSRLCDEASPSGVAGGLRRAFGFDECYVADLDAIAGAVPNFAAYDDVVAAGLRPTVDAGTGSIEQIAKIVEFFVTVDRPGRIVVGLESLTEPTTLAEIVAAVGTARLTFSLDLKQGVPLTNVSAWRERSAEELAAHAIAAGVPSIIVLDLAGVGVGGGVPTVELCRRLTAAYPHVEFLTGGGVRGVDDLRQLKSIGCHAALVASALHDGSLTPEMLREEVARGTLRR